MDANNIVVPVAVTSASITIVVISLVLIIAAMIIARSKSGEPDCVYPYVYINTTVPECHM